MSLPKISIITPSYNQGGFIKDTVDSVLSQNYPNLEYWVIDGGSTDSTVEILKSYGSKLNWISKKDKGQTHAINKGLKKSTGDILMYLNSDDILLPGSLERVGGYFQNNPDCNWVTGDCIVIDVEGNPIKGNWLIRYYKKFLMFFYSPKLLKIVDNMIPQPSTFWTKKAFQKIGKFDESLHYVMDYDYWIRLSKYFKPHNLPYVISGFRAQPDSKSETNRLQMIKEGNKMLTSNGATKFQITLHRIHSQIMRWAYIFLNSLRIR